MTLIIGEHSPVNIVRVNMFLGHNTSFQRMISIHFYQLEEQDGSN